MQLIPNTISYSSYKDAYTEQQQLNVQVARFDLIHPLVSGNKIFKLHEFLEEALANNIPNLVTMGGAFSNHLLATAFACKEMNIQSIGIVRGEDAANNPSHTLKHCKELGMQLKFVSRKQYSDCTPETVQQFLPPQCDHYIFVPEGGYHPLGAKGAAAMMNFCNDLPATHIMLATGTATTLAGLLMNNPSDKKIIAVPVLKNMVDLELRIAYLTNHASQKEFTIWNQYHFGGYAKTNKNLLEFMNKTYLQQQIPTDLVYTAKLLYALDDQIKKGFFPAGSNIIVMHTGGLQGNLSLASNVLVF